MSFRPILLAGSPIAGGRTPAVCAPLVGRTTAVLRDEARRVAALRPDMLEWRVDFFEAAEDRAALLEAAREVQAAAAGLPILFTRRSAREGGQPMTVSEAGMVERVEAVCASGLVQLVDWEIEGDAEGLQRVRGAAQRHGLPLLLSFHDFQRTPPAEVLRAKFQRAASLGADIAKIAVMPSSMEDVHTLLGATLEASRSLAIPVVSMAMGPLGAASRICGGVFGCALTFAVGAAASAPGQLPIADVRAALAMLERAGRAG
jgi:3-dehydroquinate dehydratase-1